MEVPKPLMRDGEMKPNPPILTRHEDKMEVKQASSVVISTNKLRQ